MLLGGERFYTAAFEFLPGVAVAVGASFLVVIAVAVTRRFDRLPERERPGLAGVRRTATRQHCGAVGRSNARRVRYRQCMVGRCDST